MAIRMPTKRVLVIKNRAIGDTILLTGSLRILKQHMPHAQIHVLVKAPAGELLDGLPYVDRVIAIREPSTRIERVAYWSRMVRRLRAKKYEFVLNFHASFRTALVARLIRARVCVTNHHSLKGRNWFSDLAVPGRGKSKAIIERDLDLMRCLGVVASASDAWPEVLVFQREENEARSRIAAASLGFAARRWIFLGHGASRATKRWPAEHFAELVVAASRKWPDLGYLVCTAAGDEESEVQLKAALSAAGAPTHRVLFFSSLSLREVAAMLKLCTAYVGNDSGLKHLAVAVGTRTYTIFGPESPAEWHPYDLSQHPLSYIEPLACRTETGKHWCPIQTCTRHQHQCMRSISAAEALSQLDQLVK
jgi:ADP-heptose:LPS heptosyltransferase